MYLLNDTFMIERKILLLIIEVNNYIYFHIISFAKKKEYISDS